MLLKHRVMRCQVRRAGRCGNHFGIEVRRKGNDGADGKELPGEAR